jgi:hypothetical protein
MKINFSRRAAEDAEREKYIEFKTKDHKLVLSLCDLCVSAKRAREKPLSFAVPAGCVSGNNNYPQALQRENFIIS